MIIKFEDLHTLSKEKTTFLPGCFDLFHRGHLELFKKVKSKYPDYKLVISVTNDSGIKKYKNIKGPIISEDNRLKIVDSCKYVDYVFLSPDEFPEGEDTHQYLRVKDLKPNYIFYHSLKVIHNKERLESLGSKIVILDSGIEEHTSDIVNRIKNDY